MRGYAQALAETCTDGDLTAIRELLKELSVLWHRVPDLRTAMTSPGISSVERAAILQALLEKMKPQGISSALSSAGSSVLLRLLVLLAQRRRFDGLLALAEFLDILVVERAGGLAGHVEVARMVEPNEQVRLNETIEKMFTGRLGKAARLTWSERPELLAGLRVTIDGRTYDGSLQGQMDRLKRQLLEGAEVLGK